MLLSINKRKPIFKHTKLFTAISFTLCAQLSFAQEATDPPETDNADKKIVEKVIIFGTKSNLMSAQAIKRDADTMVDAVSAEDIRVLQNRSVLDAMQRVPGITLERFAAPNDPDHFSTETSNIVIRGMTQTRSEFNGRDTFTANAGRGLSYKDISPELMSNIEIFKNQTADMVEGGIGGTVSLNTRKPFDSNEQVVAFSVDYSQGHIREEWSPTYSLLFSDRKNTGIGEFGLLLNYADSTLYGESQGVQSDAYLQYYARTLNAAPENDPGAPGTRAQDFLGGDDDGDGKPDGIVWLPSAGNVLKKQDNRERTGQAAVIQFKNNSENVLATLEYIKSDSLLSWHERAIKYQGGFHTINSRITRPLEGTYFSFDDQGLFRSGILTNGSETWRLGNSGHSRVPTQFSQLIKPNWRQWGHKTQMDSRVNDTQSTVEDTSLNIQWQVNEAFKLDADVQYVAARTANDDVSVHINTWSNMAFDLNSDVPKLSYLSPWNGVRDATRANDDSANGLEDNIWDAKDDSGAYLFPGFGGDPLGDHNFFQDPNSYLWRSAMDHYERSNGDSLAARFDGAFDTDFGILRSIVAGVRYSEREQVVRATSWNWGALAPEWAGGDSNWELEPGEIYGSGIGWLPDIAAQQEGYELVDWSNFMGGDVVAIEGNQTIHATETLIRSVMGVNPERQLLMSPVDRDNWRPYPTRTGLDAQYKLFRPGEINTTTETTNAIYIKLNFEGDGELPFSGNLGLRYVAMERVAKGAVVYPMIHPIDGDTRNKPPASLSLPLQAADVDAYFYQQVADGLYEDYDSAAYSLENDWTKNPYFFLPTVQRDFSQPILDENGAYRPVEELLETVVDYETLLPSFNIKVDLTQNLVARFAVAKALAFPDMGDVRNRTEFPEIPQGKLIEQYRTVELEGVPDVELLDKASVDANGGDILWVGGGGNPALQPMESIQYDFSLEWYFSDVGQLSTAIFHKNLYNYFSQGVVTREFTHPDTQVTQKTAITTTRNAGNAKLDGFEITYHQFFRGWLENFGVQATYTYVDANSVPNNQTDIADERWYNSIYEDTGIRVNFSRLPLEGQSDQTINLMGIFENEKWSARLAYNWRSKYLLTTRDVISKAPQWYDDHGELDASVFYHITDAFTVGIDVKNITNERSDIIMILNDDLLSAGRSWFEADRRLALILRAEF